MICAGLKKISTEERGAKMNEVKLNRLYANDRLKNNEASCVAPQFAWSIASESNTKIRLNISLKTLMMRIVLAWSESSLCADSRWYGVLSDIDLSVCLKWCLVLHSQHVVTVHLCWYVLLNSRISHWPETLQILGDVHGIDHTSPCFLRYHPAGFVVQRVVFYWH